MNRNKDIVGATKQTKRCGRSSVREGTEHTVNEGAEVGSEERDDDGLENRLAGAGEPRPDGESAEYEQGEECRMPGQKCPSPSASFSASEELIMFPKYSYGNSCSCHSCPQENAFSWFLSYTSFGSDSCATNHGRHTTLRTNGETLRQWVEHCLAETSPC